METSHTPITKDNLYNRSKKNDTAYKQAANHYRWQTIHSPKSIFHDMDLLLVLYTVFNKWKSYRYADLSIHDCDILEEAANLILLNAEKIIWDIYNNDYMKYVANNAHTEEYKIVLARLWEFRIDNIFQDYLKSLDMEI